MKKIISIVLTVLLVLSLCACSIEIEKNTKATESATTESKESKTTEETKETQESKETKETTKETETAKETEKPTKETKETETTKETKKETETTTEETTVQDYATWVKTEVVNTADAAQIFKITGYNDAGEKQWEYQTHKRYVAQFDSFRGFGVANNCYVFNDAGNITAVSMKDGTVAWVNSDFGGMGATFEWLNGKFYICGYDTPDLFVIDWSGKTIAKIDKLTGGEYFWGRLETIENGKLRYHYDGPGEGATILVDPNNYSYVFK